MNEKFGKGGDSFPLFSESASRLYMPRAWAMKRFGVPQANIVSEGERLPTTVAFGGKPFDYQTDIINKFIGAGGNGLICVPCGKGKTFMALAVVALTAACSPNAEPQSAAEAAGPAADEALAAANASEVVTEEAAVATAVKDAVDASAPQADSK